MRTTSKILLGLSAAIVCVLFAYVTPTIRHSKPDFTKSDSRALLDGISNALNRKSQSKVMAYFDDNATIVGKDVPTIRNYLQRGFAYSRNLDVHCDDPSYDRKGDTVTITTHVVAGEKPPSGGSYTEEYYNGDVTFTLKRIATPRLGGLFETFDWKIVDVFARNVPHPEFLEN